MKRLALLLAAAAFAVGWACRPQLPPGPAPEYERPVVEPWDAGVTEDPLVNIEAEGEWADDAPGAAGAAASGASDAGRPAAPPDAGAPAAGSATRPPAADAGAPK